MKRVISLAVSTLMVLTLVLPCAALNISQNNIEATYTGKYGELTIKFTYFDYPFQLH